MFYTADQAAATKRKIFLCCVHLTMEKDFFDDDVKTIIYHMTLRIALSDLLYAPDQLIDSFPPLYPEFFFPAGCFPLGFFTSDVYPLRIFLCDELIVSF